MHAGQWEVHGFAPTQDEEKMGAKVFSQTGWNILILSIMDLQNTS